MSWRCLRVITNYGISGKVSGHVFKKAMSHLDDNIFQAYMSSIINVDAQSVVRGLPQDSEHLDKTRSIAFTRNLNNPKPHGSALKKCTLPPGQEIIDQVIAGFPGIKMSEVMKKARRLQYVQDRDHHRNTVTFVPDTERDTECPADFRVRPEPTLLFRRMLKHNTLQADVISKLWSGRPVSIKESVQSLLALASPHEVYVGYPPPVMPPTADMLCPYCDFNLRKAKKRARALHLLQCHCFTHRTSYCFECAEFSDKENHTCEEPRSEHLTCGVIFWRDVLIKPGRCPFCSDKARWTDPPKLKVHIESHLQGLQEGAFDCPHRLCSQQHKSADDLQSHLVSVHGIDMQSKSTRGKKRSAERVNG